MSFDWITKTVVSPIFFFLFLTLAALTLASLYAAFMKNTSFIVVSMMLFVLAFNAFRLGWKLYRESA